MIRCYLPAIVLVAVALVQRYLMEYQRLDPWKGGGFGMFSAISARNLRQMTVTLIPTNGEEKRFPPAGITNRIPLDGDMRWYRSRLLTMPRPAMLQELADILANSKWVAIEPQPAGETDAIAATDVVAADEQESLEQTGEKEPSLEEYYRMRRDIRGDVRARPLALREARVEIWEYRLQSDSSALELTRLAAAAARPAAR